MIDCIHSELEFVVGSFSKCHQRQSLCGLQAFCAFHPMSETTVSLVVTEVAKVLNALCHGFRSKVSLQLFHIFQETKEVSNMKISVIKTNIQTIVPHYFVNGVRIKHGQIYRSPA